MFFGLALLAACAHPRLTLPTDAGVPAPDFQAVHAQVSAACLGVRTFTSELGLSGRAGRQRLRGRVVAGFSRGGSMRLEGVAPFGPPAFILAVHQGSAILLLPRESRVLRDAPSDDVLGALTGVRLAPDDLLAILSGCVVPDPQPTDGRSHLNGWLSVDVQGGTLFMQRQAGQWRLRAAMRSGWRIEYEWLTGQFPAAVHLQSLEPGPMVDLTATLSQIEVNVDLEDAAFTVAVPPTAGSLTLDDLRQNGPLGAR